MDSLYTISNELLGIFVEIEENGGELTPELEKSLEITQNNYAAKMENYAKVVNQYKSNIAVIKEEKKRLDRRKEIFENRIAKLEEVMLKAVEQFGKVETGLYKIGTRKTKSTYINAERIHKLNQCVFNFAREIHNNGVIAFGEECDVEGMLAVINANAKADHDILTSMVGEEHEFVPYTIDDLSAINVNINSTSSIMDLFTKKDGMLEAVLNNEMYFDVEPDNSKTEMKQHLEAGENLTVADINVENKLSIR